MIVCNEAGLRLEASNVMVNGVTMRSLDSGGGGSISDAELCALLGARYEDLNAGTYGAEIKISEPVTGDDCSGGPPSATAQDPDRSLKMLDRPAEPGRE